MIFVTVGTHEQQFNRLVKCVDGMKKNHEIDEDVFIQTGFCDYEPLNCEWEKFLPYQRMIDMVQEARIVITHGGPSSFILPLQYGKIPIVVPRHREYGEHINDHQVNFCRIIEERFRNIIVADSDDKLMLAIRNYDNIEGTLSDAVSSNNERFNKSLEKLVREMFQ